MTIYLYVNAFLYFLFAIWCTIKTEGSSKFLGYSFLNNSGRIEYITIYGGLQLGFGIFLLYCAYKDRFDGVIFCIALYAGIVLARVSSILILRKDITSATYMVGSLELLLLLWGMYVWYQKAM